MRYVFNSFPWPSDAGKRQSDAQNGRKSAAWRPQYRRERFGDAHRLGRAFALDVISQVICSRWLSIGSARQQFQARTQPAAHRHRRDETHLVEPIVHAHGRLDNVDTGLERSAAAVTASESRARWVRQKARPWPLHVDVDPLVVARGLGKQVDLLLGDGDPVADRDLLAGAGQPALEGLKVFMVSL
jgi:hypothetical protein